ncbi:MAG: hypothetical protein M1826_006520 [Phylliscum demangeonii]|nr:MAG: hypothetical protein M1826_006520 [Phylliscum demangeonii]
MSSPSPFRPGHLFSVALLLALLSGALAFVPPNQTPHQASKCSGPSCAALKLSPPSACPEWLMSCDSKECGAFDTFDGRFRCRHGAPYTWSDRGMSIAQGAQTAQEILQRDFGGRVPESRPPGRRSKTEAYNCGTPSHALFAHLNQILTDMRRGKWPLAQDWSCLHHYCEQRDQIKNQADAILALACEVAIDVRWVEREAVTAITAAITQYLAEHWHQAN